MKGLLLKDKEFYIDTHIFGHPERIISRIKILQTQNSRQKKILAYCFYLHANLLIPRQEIREIPVEV